jgi:predicted lipoprotein with Yx(FWY)xxD motif
MDTRIRTLMMVSACLALAACDRISPSAGTESQEAEARSDELAKGADAEAATAADAAAAAAAPGATPAEAGEVSAIAVASTDGVGAYLVDSVGRSLYVFDKDLGASACYDACRQRWPALVVPTEETGAIAPPVEAGRVGKEERRDRALQYTYFGRPLYLYTGDAAAGERNGHDLTDEFGHWSLVGTDGKPLATK